MKPFGVFLDIGCHSDAFCHISRISDEYVERPEDVFKEGDEVQGVRIVEVDRKSKRLTVSLQSEARMADEHASSQARKERKEKNQSAKRQKSSAKKPQREEQAANEEQSASKHIKFDTSYQKPAAPAPKPAKKVEESPKPSTTATLPSKPESEMTPAELKRARKIARRAARRAEQDAKQ